MYNRRMEKDFNLLGTWLPPLVKKTGLTFEQFARKVKVSRTAIYAYMVDNNRPETQTMVRICRVLGVPLEEGLRQYTPKKRGNPNFGPDNPYTRGLKRRT
jgi:transcriptional regulator with XRE-family HTH domain